jgi:hypothetical protein
LTDRWDALQFFNWNFETFARRYVANASGGVVK